MRYLSRNPRNAQNPHRSKALRRSITQGASLFKPLLEGDYGSYGSYNPENNRQFRTPRGDYGGVTRSPPLGQGRQASSLASLRGVGPVRRMAWSASSPIPEATVAAITGHRQRGRRTGQRPPRRMCVMT